MKKSIIIARFIIFSAMFLVFAGCFGCGEKKEETKANKTEGTNEMVVAKYVLGELEANCYLLYDEINKKACLIDPGAYDQGIMDFISKEGLSCEYIILTHGHFDHIAGAEAFKEKTGAQIAAHELEEEYLLDPEKSMTFYFDGETVSADVFFKGGDMINFGDFSLEIIHTPGHSKGSSCFVYENGGRKIMFSGDTLFMGTIGRYDFYGGDYDILMQSLEKLRALKTNCKIYSGHGEETYLDDEIANNPYYKNLLKNN
ncbi:MAG: MBL fold metallo-hydrolase [Oscillospiraceae bacterium]|nr:MBL fold metallo-hydrolase [Oscillospiraceae bacterium]